MKSFLFVLLLFLGLFANAQNESGIVDFPDVEAEFPGGPAAMQKFIVANLKYPKEAINKNITGKVYASFVVQSDGTITNVQIERSVHPSLDAETVRVLQSMPRWKPAEVEGKKVACRCRVPIVYTLTNGNDKPKKKRRWRRR